MSTEPETPPAAPEPPLTYEPATYYDTTVTCTTEGCINYATVWEATPLYSNAGTPNIIDGICGQPLRVLTATVIDPQPIFD